MANKRHDRPDGSAGGAVATREKRVSDASNDDRRNAAASAGTENAAAANSAFYKPGQGYYTRLWTAIGAGALVLWFVAFIWNKLSILSTSGQNTLIIQVAVAVVILAIAGFIGFKVLGTNKTVCEFLINTEGEMKKVNWSTRKEVIGSTKVVIFVLLAMSVLLFVVDIAFLVLFTKIGVLRGEDIINNIFGGGS